MWSGKGKWSKLLLGAFAGLTTIGCAVLIGRAAQYWQGELDYAEAAELAAAPELPALSELSPTLEQTPAPTDPGVTVSKPDFADAPLPLPSKTVETQEQEQETTEPNPWVDPYAEALCHMDFAALREVNEDVLGWIFIPGASISYPLVQGDDNEYYLDHTWRRRRNSVGAIFMEYQNTPDLSDFNTIIFGHRVSNRAMFGLLGQYSSWDFWAARPYLYLSVDSGSYRYTIFAAYEVPVDGLTYRLSFMSDEEKQAFIDYCLSSSVLDTGVIPTVHDRVVTLSTCTGTGHKTRWVVQAVLTAAPE